MVKAWCACKFKGGTGTLARSKSRLQFQFLLLTRAAGAGTTWQKCLLQVGERPVLSSSSDRLVAGISFPAGTNTALAQFLLASLSSSQSFAIPPFFKNRATTQEFPRNTLQFTASCRLAMLQ